MANDAVDGITNTTAEPAGPAEGTPDSAKLVVEVSAGQFPGRPDHEHSRHYMITSRRWEQASPAKRMELLAETAGEAQGYAMLLMLQPERVNWVRCDWVWF